MHSMKTKSNFLKAEEGASSVATMAICLMYLHSRNHNSRDFRSCKDQKDYDPQCKGRLTTCGDVVISAAANYHTVSSTEAAAALFIAELRDTKSTKTAENVVRDNIISSYWFQIYICLINFFH